MEIPFSVPSGCSSWSLSVFISTLCVAHDRILIQTSWPKKKRCYFSLKIVKSTSHSLTWTPVLSFAFCSAGFLLGKVFSMVAYIAPTGLKLSSLTNSLGNFPFSSFIREFPWLIEPALSPCICHMLILNSSWGRCSPPEEGR